MSNFLSFIGPWVDALTANLWRASIAGGIAIAVVWIIVRSCSSLSPRVVCWLWRLAAAKMLIAFVWAQPITLAVLPAKSAISNPARIQTVAV
ncbi:MAG TPA: hypothetical protein VGI75_09770, partial [Pirellulales bacterium]